MNTHRLREAFFVLILTVGIFSEVRAQDPLETLQDHDVTTNVNETRSTGVALNVREDSAPASAGFATTKSTAYTIGVLSDLHIRNENRDGLESAIKAINGLAGMNAVAITGDLDSKVASPDEFELVRKSLGKFNVPVFAVTGNHDYIYNNTLDQNGKKSRANPKLRK